MGIGALYSCEVCCVIEPSFSRISWYLQILNSFRLVLILYTFFLELKKKVTSVRCGFCPRSVWHNLKDMLLFLVSVDDFKQYLKQNLSECLRSTNIQNSSAYFQRFTNYYHESEKPNIVFMCSSYAFSDTLIQDFLCIKWHQTHMSVHPPSILGNYEVAVASNLTTFINIRPAVLELLTDGQTRSA